MILSDLSVTRPVLAAVMSLLLVAFGLVSFDRLPLREYPDIDPPVVSVETNYRGAAANVVESRITRLIEDRIAGIEGIFCGASAIYFAMAQVLNAEYGRTILPIGELAKVKADAVNDDAPASQLKAA